MNFKNLITIVPIALAVIGGLYSSINYVSNLNNDLDATMRAIDVQAVQIEELQKDYAQGREELVKEMTNAYAQITGLQAKMDVVRDALYRTASEAEQRAMEDNYYKLDDALRQMKYDIKELERKLLGGY
jgi:predicted nuclease with TOPRIM domain|tara:strand:+ start:122 stop:508 length:387 start_codon:yes stop_codon:yes gene_type:complete